MGRAQSCKLHVAHPFSRCFTDTDATNRPRASGNQLRRQSLPGQGKGQASTPHPRLCYCSACITLGKSLKASPPFSFLLPPRPPFFFNCPHLPPSFTADQITDSSFRNSVLQQLGWSIHETPPVPLENRTS